MKLSESIATNYSAIQARVKRAGGEGRTKIVAVTKTQPLEVIEAAVKGGLSDFGENYADELIFKAEAFAPEHLRWHMIGALQSRSIAKLSPHVSVWHSVSRKKEIDHLARAKTVAPILVQVDYSDSALRNGVAPGEVAELAEYGRALALNLTGLMVVTPLVGLDERTKIFAATYRLGVSLGLTEFSMGMTDDFEPAVQEGSTMVRIGRAIFGDRPQ